MAKVSSNQIRDLLPVILDSKRAEIEAALTDWRAKQQASQSGTLRVLYPSLGIGRILDQALTWKRTSKQRLDNKHWVRRLVNSIGSQASVETDPTDSTILGVHLSLVASETRKEDCVFWEKQFDAKTLATAFILHPSKAVRLQGVGLATEYSKAKPGIEDTSILKKPLITAKDAQAALKKVLFRYVPTMGGLFYQVHWPFKSSRSKSGRAWYREDPGGKSMRVQTNPEGDEITRVYVTFGKEFSEKWKCPEEIDISGDRLTKLIGPTPGLKR